MTDIKQSNDRVALKMQEYHENWMKTQTEKKTESVSTEVKRTENKCWLYHSEGGRCAGEVRPDPRNDGEFICTEHSDRCVKYGVPHMRRLHKNLDIPRHSRPTHEDNHMVLSATRRMVRIANATEKSSTITIRAVNNRDIRAILVRNAMELGLCTDVVEDTRATVTKVSSEFKAELTQYRQTYIDDGQALHSHYIKARRDAKDNIVEVASRNLRIWRP